MKPDESLEQAARQQGYAVVCGCDEAGCRTPDGSRVRGRGDPAAGLRYPGLGRLQEADGEKARDPV